MRDCADDGAGEEDVSPIVVATKRKIMTNAYNPKGTLWTRLRKSDIIDTSLSATGLLVILAVLIEQALYLAAHVWAPLKIGVKC